MNTRNIISWSYAISVATTGLSIYTGVTESANMLTTFIIALLSQIVFAVLAVYELRRSEHFTKGEKADFTILIFCAPLIFGTFYLLKMRKRIVYT
jgi:hypothetical protein